jgi:pimeloyl-ACP methyl ester carboxylesterase
MAQKAAHAATRARTKRVAAARWLDCSLNAYPGWHAMSADRLAASAELANRCTEALLGIEGSALGKQWASGPAMVAGTEAVIEMRAWDSPPPLSLSLKPAGAVSMSVYGGKRYRRDGFGVPLAMVWPRCTDSDRCQLLPPEGVFRDATAWIEPGEDQVRLVIADPKRLHSLDIDGTPLPLARDTSAAYAQGVSSSKLSRLALLGLLGGREVGRRSGVYLLEDYDPDKRPVVMIHGLGSSPLVWARVSNAIWGDPILASEYQLWHVVYQTNAPLLVTRLRIQGYLDDAWRILDPEGDDPARNGMVLVGHSMGGVLSRLLAADSGDILWNAAFVVPPEQLQGAPDDLALLRAIFRFEHYPGVTNAVFLAAPHRGAPAAGSWWGRLSRVLVGRRTSEIRVLQRVTAQQPEAVSEGLRESYLQARLNSISTLQTFQPVRAAGESLLPVQGVQVHSIIGIKPGSSPPGDGVVPAASAELEGAASTLFVPGDHSLPFNDDALAEVLRILHESRLRAVPTAEPPPL